ncbi:hypothetical protein A2363_02255 [Candidatus Gottesmanbacteria bacterium RIFOXYB1_FULL_47_11]|uniref:50S ribosomal protein L29 n=1 Tax=Candidatus Gottesmanbacteria bacterium RIFOXYB1_FULL_47_11 TaxID=1798401 RepID=A0A1F6BE53_9BACT|nr:MAG: hypothetical protein A2363_02255 [Candidatus Gottesmanbacteria bacterium RIFOXYB1_FULL_47_11]
MKTKEKQTLISMKREELEKVLTDAQNALAILLVNRYSKQSKNAREARVLRSKIAVISTYMRQKELTHE